MPLMEPLTGVAMHTAVNEFLTPRHIDVSESSPTHARVVLEPLERRQLLAGEFDLMQADER